MKRKGEFYQQPGFWRFLALAFALPLLLWSRPVPAAKTMEPVAHGAWLYGGHCLRCHGDYQQGRMAEEIDGKKELEAAISGRRCRVNWSRRCGGPFDSKQLRDVVAYMLAWEKSGGALQLPELPPWPSEKEARAEKRREKAAKQEKKEKSRQQAAQDAKGATAITPALRRLMARQPVAHGGWLYTNNCYRCHLTYQQGRMGQGMQPDTVRRFIREGKTSTQMTAFSRMLGGPLKTAEIDDIVRYITAWEEKKEPLAIAGALMIPPAADPGELKPLRLPRFKQVQGNNANGSRLFRRHCMVCHGGRGEGVIGPALAADKLGVRPDLYLKSVVKQGIPGTVMRSWELSRKGPLSARDIEDLVGFLAGW